MAFAASLSKIVTSKKQQLVERQEVASKWTEYESKLLSDAVNLFRQRCVREASQRRSQLTASFEVLSRDVEGFPTHVIKDSTYVVSSWGSKGVTAAAWFYATHGINSSYSEGAPVLFAEMLEGMMPKFLDQLRPLGFTTCGREAGTWKVTVSWRKPDRETNGENGAGHDRTGEKFFAQELVAIVESKSAEDKQKQALSGVWKDYESDLLDAAVDLFKQRCRREAELQRLEATVSFEVLSREIEDFPKRVVRDSNYFVDSWGGGVTSESWFYATHGTNATFNEAEPVLFAEVLECMMPKFIERLRSLGFLKCQREPGTWKISVAWPDPEGEAASKRLRHR